MTIFEPGSPRDALSTLRIAIGHLPANPKVTAALQTLDQFIADMLVDAPGPDQARILELVDNAEWEPSGPGPGVMVAYHGIGGSTGPASEIIDALSWECTTCRPDVGWADWTRMERDSDGTILMYVECGHCGADYIFDINGDQVEAD